jgi:hypothetical protein
MGINIITSQDAQQRLSDYIGVIEEVGSTIPSGKGLALIKELKRGKTGCGPYPSVSLFEAANRIMTDLVILNGVKWLLEERIFGFSAYTVEYGHQNNNSYDIEASEKDRTLIGEAFNVAPSFFQGKKSAMLRKLRIDETANIKLVMFNHDAVAPGYKPSPPAGVHFMLVDVSTGHCRLEPPG